MAQDVEISTIKYAIKIVYRGSITDEEIAVLAKDYEKHQKFQHPNIAKTY